ncbi:MAG: DUF2344 domain-containing protein, partial [Candidatus Atribacteria bacterium]|nr:DUF2344 domain-containing protein [Candidatus Atribacteria bacterium]
VINEVQKIPDSSESLNKLLRFADYLILFDFEENGHDPNRDWENWINVQINQFLSQRSIKVEKKTKKGFREVDLKSYIVSMEYVSRKNSEVIVRLLLDIRTMGSINPQIIINAFLDQLAEKDIRLKEIIREKIILDSQENA